MLRRKAVWLVIGTALAVLAGACSGAAGNSSAAGGKADPAGVLRFGYDLSTEFTNTFDPGKSNGDCDNLVFAYLYDPLIVRDQYTNELKPGLAASWAVDPDAKGFTLQLRQGVTFQDGTAFNADAAKAALEHNKLNPQYDDFAYVQSIDVAGPFSLRLTLKKAYALPMLYGLSSREGLIGSPAAFSHAGTKPAGTGPFVLDSFTPGARIQLRRNPNYWNKNPYKTLSGIDLVQVAIGPPAVTALRSGSVDLVEFQPESYDSIKADSSAVVVAQPSGAYLQVQMRNAPPFDKLKVRQAMEFAINRDEINQVVASGQGEVTDQPFRKGTPAYDPALATAYPYDPARAKQLLVEAGVPNGFSFDMIIPGGNITFMERQGAIIQQQLAKVGIKANIIRVLPNDLSTGYYVSRQGNAFAAESLAASLDPGLLFNAYGQFQFVAIYNNNERPDVTALVLQAYATTDLNQAEALTRQASKIVVDQALEIPIAFMPQLIAYAKARIGGPVRGPDNICDPPDLTQAYVRKP